MTIVDLKCKTEPTFKISVAYWCQCQCCYCTCIACSTHCTDSRDKSGIFAMQDLVDLALATLRLKIIVFLKDEF